MQRIILILFLFLGACRTVQSVHFTSGIGEELREEATNNRVSISVGPGIKFTNHSEIKFKYRSRITDFQSHTLEHGFFIDTTFPIWELK